MTVHGKIVIIKRNGSDGTEFPLTMPLCMFGRKPDCDIRIQLPHVSKEHCKLEINENKAVILTNLSLVNPTCVNGNIVPEPKQLKHGDIITIIDRSFRFEYPNATPRKRRSTAGNKTLQVKETVGHLSENKSEFTALISGTADVLNDEVEQKNESENLNATPANMAVKAHKQKILDGSSPFSQLYKMLKNQIEANDKSNIRLTDGKPPTNVSDSASLMVQSPKRKSQKIFQSKVLEMEIFENKQENPSLSLKANDTSLEKVVSGRRSQRSSCNSLGSDKRVAESLIIESQEVKAETPNTRRKSNVIQHVVSNADCENQVPDNDKESRVLETPKTCRRSGTSSSLSNFVVSDSSVSEPLVSKETPSLGTPKSSSKGRGRKSLKSSSLSSIDVLSNEMLSTNRDVAVSTTSTQELLLKQVDGRKNLSEICQSHVSVTGDHNKKTRRSSQAIHRRSLSASEVLQAIQDSHLTEVLDSISDQNSESCNVKTRRSFKAETVASQVNSSKQDSTSPRLRTRSVSPAKVNQLPQKALLQLPATSHTNSPTPAIQSPKSETKKVLSSSRRSSSLAAAIKSPESETEAVLPTPRRPGRPAASTKSPKSEMEAVSSTPRRANNSAAANQSPKSETRKVLSSPRRSKSPAATIKSPETETEEVLSTPRRPGRPAVATKSPKSETKAALTERSRSPAAAIKSPESETEAVLSTPRRPGCPAAATKSPKSETAVVLSTPRRSNQSPESETEAVLPTPRRPGRPAAATKSPKSETGVVLSTPRRSSSPAAAIKSPESETKAVVSPRRSNSPGAAIKSPESDTETVVSTPRRPGRPAAATKSPKSETGVVLSTPRRSNSPAAAIKSPESETKAVVSTPRRSNSPDSSIKSPGGETEAVVSTPRKPGRPAATKSPKSETGVGLSTPRRSNSPAAATKSPESETEAVLSTPRRRGRPAAATKSPKSETAVVLSTPRRSNSPAASLKSPESKTDAVSSTPKRPGHPAAVTKLPNSEEENSPRKRSVSSVTRGMMLEAGENDTMPSPSTSNQISTRKRRSGEHFEKLSEPSSKRKRVSFGGHLSPEIFDRRLPPNSPLKKGAAPLRLSLSVMKKKKTITKPSRYSISVVGSSMMKESLEASTEDKSIKKSSPGRLLPKVSSTPQKLKTPSPRQKSTNKLTQSVTPDVIVSASAAETVVNSSVESLVKTPSPGTRARRSAANIEFESVTKVKGLSVSNRKSLQDRKSVSFVSEESPLRKPVDDLTFPSPSKKSHLKNTVVSLGNLLSDSNKNSTKLDISLSDSPRSSPRTKSVVDPGQSHEISISTLQISPRNKQLSESESTPDKKHIVVIGTPRSSPRNRSLISSSGTNTAAVADSVNLASPKRRSSPGVSTAPNESSERTPYVRGRFSISRIHTPSPSTEENAPKSVNADKNINFTPKHVQERKSLSSTAKKSITKSRRKSAIFGSVRTRRSGALQSSLFAKKSWADIVKLGVAKSKTVAAARKPSSRKKHVKKVSSKVQKTPVQKIKEHFSTGHAESPATIVIGRAHRSVQVVGQAPRLVQNVALLKNMEMNESFTGIDVLFSTPPNYKVKRSSRCSTDLEVPVITSLSPSEASTMKTPEETGEMVVSPLSLPSTLRRGRYNREAVSRLLQEEYSGAESPSKPLNRSASRNIKTSSINVENPMTSDQKLDCLENLGGVTKLVQTPKQKTVVQYSKSKDVKRIMKTPKKKSDPVEDFVGLKRILRTPKEKAVVEDSTKALEGVKRILRTPKQKSEHVEDLRGLKRLLRSPKEPKVSKVFIEDLTGVKTIMRTPKQKSQPVEDMIGIKRIMTTPKQKGSPVDSAFGISRIMKSPKQKHTPVKDFAGLTSLFAEPQQTGGQTINTELLITKNIRQSRRLSNEHQEGLTPSHKAELILEKPTSPKTVYEPAPVASTSETSEKTVAVSAASVQSCFSPPKSRKSPRGNRISSDILPNAPLPGQNDTSDGNLLVSACLKTTESSLNVETVKPVKSPVISRRSQQKLVAHKNLTSTTRSTRSRRGAHSESEENLSCVTAVTSAVISEVAEKVNTSISKRSGRGSGKEVAKKIENLELPAKKSTRGRKIQIDTKESRSRSEEVSGEDVKECESLLKLHTSPQRPTSAKKPGRKRKTHENSLDMTLSEKNSSPNMTTDSCAEENSPSPALAEDASKPKKMVLQAKHAALSGLPRKSSHGQNNKPGTDSQNVAGASPVKNDTIARSKRARGVVKGTSELEQSVPIVSTRSVRNKAKQVSDQSEIEFIEKNLVESEIPVISKRSRSKALKKTKEMVKLAMSDGTDLADPSLEKSDPPVTSETSPNFSRNVILEAETISTVSAHVPVRMGTRKRNSIDSETKGEETKKATAVLNRSRRGTGSLLVLTDVESALDINSRKTSGRRKREDINTQTLISNVEDSGTKKNLKAEKGSNTTLKKLRGKKVVLELSESDNVESHKIVESSLNSADEKEVPNEATNMSETKSKKGRKKHVNWHPLLSETLQESKELERQASETKSNTPDAEVVMLQVTNEKSPENKSGGELTKPKGRKSAKSKLLQAHNTICEDASAESSVEVVTLPHRKGRPSKTRLAAEALVPLEKSTRKRKILDTDTADNPVLESADQEQLISKRPRREKIIPASKGPEDLNSVTSPEASGEVTVSIRRGRRAKCGNEIAVNKLKSEEKLKVAQGKSDSLQTDNNQDAAKLEKPLRRGKRVLAETAIAESVISPVKSLRGRRAVTEDKTSKNVHDKLPDTEIKPQRVSRRGHYTEQKTNNKILNPVKRRK
ncbi:proliferation marker protein Ki-67 isoform X3 [Polypterus senegalus]|uniref:proliferation marker protein Ki-67 isoform X3 n=1 Tax=Polypterus senegalus TaxID=55291 RepID=UPI0019626A76|nr:proliferation marker protein Ki-67 isoform X3 [Polypterus senegalus]